MPGFSPNVLGGGTHAGRPSATGLPDGSTWFCSDHNAAEQIAAGAWGTVLTGGGAAVTWADLDDDHDAHDHTGVPGVGGGGGGGGGGVAVRHSPSQAPDPGEAEDDEFDDESIDAKWTRIAHGTPRGTWAEKHDSIVFRHTVAGTHEIDGWSQPWSPTVGDVIEAAFEWETSILLGMALGFSSSGTYGSGSQVSANIHNNGDTYRYMLNAYSGFASRSADGDIVNKYRMGQVAYVRVKYEAANSFGLYSSRDGVEWDMVDNNHAVTLTPTHIFVGASMTGTTAPSTPGPILRVHYVRLNPPDA